MSLRTVTQSDGRRLAWAEYGDPAGEPLLYMHGTPSCHLEATAFGADKAATRLGLRLIVIDRPGMSDSTFQRDRRVLGVSGCVVGIDERATCHPRLGFAFALAQQEEQIRRRKD